MKKPKNIINKLLVVFGVIFAGYSVFFAGFNAAHHWYQSMGIDLLVAGFWILLIPLFVMTDRVGAEGKMLGEQIEQLEKFTEALKKLADHHEQELHENDLSHQAFEQYLRVTKGGGRAPNKREQKKIVDKFHEDTGHYLKITSHGKEGGDFEISNEPFTEDNKPTKVNKSKKKG